ncbi:MAG: hypothetical protein FGM32_09405 [Candidatus Kapabacteria bacterium]|nr:hypothetical protein [Candidatus Kapabacteria bacterium]
MSTDQMDLSRIEELYHRMRDNDDIDRLQNELNHPNIFRLLAVQRQEIRHSNFLAWLLDPNANHGLGALFITRILRHLSIASGSGVNKSIQLEKQATAVLEVRREWKNIDILIESERAVICLENKVDSTDSTGQLSRYRRIVEDQYRASKDFVVYVYLTPSGEQPNDFAEAQHWIPMSYQLIVEHLQRIVQLHSGQISEKTAGYIQDYISLLKRDIMANDEVMKLADVIYRNHKELFDFVFENKMDIAESLYRIIEEEIQSFGWCTKSKNKGFVRFLTKELEPVIPHLGKGWPGKESFLFEINFYWQKGKLVFKSVIPPTDNKELQEVLRKAVAEVDGAKKPSGKQYLVHFTKSWSFDIDKFYNVSKDEVLCALKPMWPLIEEVVTNVEASLLRPDVLAKLKMHRSVTNQPLESADLD